MTRWGAALALTLAGWAASAAATDKPVYAPPPDWVRPVTVPPVPAKDDGSAVQILLFDQQVMLRPGQSTVFTDSAFRINSPQALSAGSISFPWRPDFDTVTVHRLVIHRGDQAIDVLKAGQTFTVMRRETNLENATLDGVLTANIQPEGLQVGDVVEVAASVTSADPTLGPHMEFIGSNWNALPIERAHLRVSWPTASPVRWRVTPLMGAPRPVVAGGMTSIEVSADHLPAAVLPREAPGRFRVGRLAEFTDYAGWGDLAAVMAPLYAKAAAIKPGGALAGELATLKALPTPEERAQAALALVQDRVRYVALAMGAGGLTPADAETTWARRFGDCKGKTVLLLALLHGLGIEAEPVVVRAEGADGLDARLPVVSLFDHVLVRARVGSRTYWLDGTRHGDRDLARIRTPNTGWGLPLVAHGAALVRMLPDPLDRPQDDLAIRLDMRDGVSLPARAHGEETLRGDLATVFAEGLAQLAPEARDRGLRDYWRAKLDFVAPEKVSASFDSKTGEETLVLDGTGKPDWSHGGYETDGTVIGYHADFHRDPGPDRDAPFAVAYPYFLRVVETIQLPPTFAGRDDGTSNVDETIAGIAYHRRVTLVPGTFTVEKTERSVAPEFPYKDAAAAEERLRTLGNSAVWLMRPANYRPTDGELAAQLATTPADANAFVVRGNAFMERQRYDEAISDFTHAIALDPKNVWAFADRGLAHAHKGEAGLAKADLDAGTAIDPRNAVVLRGRGLMAEMTGDQAAAVAIFTDAIAADPNDGFAYFHRSEDYHALRDDEHALADSAAALKLLPGASQLRLLRANIYHNQGKADEAAAEMQAATAAAAPTDAWTHVAAGKIYAVLGRQPAAMAEFDRALAIKPEAFIYENRADIRADDDFAGRRADLDAALTLDPGFSAALIDRAELLTRMRDNSGALAAWDAVIAKNAHHPVLLVRRGVARLRFGQATLAEADFKAARAQGPEPVVLNDICWFKAIGGVALESAVTDCTAALAAKPGEASFLDSRAFAELRLGKLDAAIADYDGALAKQPKLATSLYGRAIARARKGDQDKAAADFAAARKANVDVDKEFARYGVTH